MSEHVSQTSRRRVRPPARVAAVALLVVAVLGLSGASAASLTITSSARDTVAAGSANLESCRSSVTPEVSKYGWDQPNGRFIVSEVLVSDIAALCAGKSISVAILGSTGQVIGVNSSPTTAASTSTRVSIAFADAPAAAQDAHRIQVVIS